MSNERYLRWDGLAPRGRQLPVLWPVDVWDVFARDGGRSLNVFQEGILGALRAGISDRRQIGELLSLEPDLVAFIVGHELIPNGWLDQQFQVTPAGLRLLSGGVDDSGQLRAQYAFRDGVFGTWLPRLSRELPDITPVEFGDSSFPLFRGSRETGGDVRPFVLPRRHVALRANKAEVLEAWRRCRSDMASRAGSAEAPSLSYVGGDDIEIAGSNPQRAYVWCEIIHLPGDLYPWLVTDPWRVTVAAKWLRDPLEADLHAIPGLVDRIAAKVLPEADTSVMTADAVRRELQREVDVRMSRWRNLDRPDLSLVQDQLRKVLRQRTRVERLMASEQEELGSLVLECASMLEAVVQWILQKWPAHAQDWPDERHSRRAMCELLESIPVSAPLPERAKEILAGQSMRDVKLAAIHRNRAFKALLFAALLTTHIHETHPLRALSAEQLQWERLLSAVEMRNKGSHASGSKLERAAVLREADFCIDWVDAVSTYF